MELIYAFTSYSLQLAAILHLLIKIIQIRSKLARQPQLKRVLCAETIRILLDRSTSLFKRIDLMSPFTYGNIINTMILALMIYEHLKGC